jgi:hypothetical protein
VPFHPKAPSMHKQHHVFNGLFCVTEVEKMELYGTVSGLCCCSFAHVSGGQVASSMCCCVWRLTPVTCHLVTCMHLALMACGCCWLTWPLHMLVLTSVQSHLVQDELLQSCVWLRLPPCALLHALVLVPGAVIFRPPACSWILLLMVPQTMLNKLHCCLWGFSAAQVIVLASLALLSMSCAASAADRLPPID